MAEASHGEARRPGQPFLLSHVCLFRLWCGREAGLWEGGGVSLPEAPDELLLVFGRRVGIEIK